MAPFAGTVPVKSPGAVRRRRGGRKWCLIASPEGGLSGSTARRIYRASMIRLNVALGRMAARHMASSGMK